MKIQSKIIKQELVSWRNLKWLQSSKLKDLGAKGIDKLKNSLKENNFVQPFNVWQDGKGTIWILDGHHREKALKQLEAEGYEIPELLPANFVECTDRKEAAKMVLLYSSIYAKITNEGLGEFLDDFELDISNLLNEIDLPGLDFDSILEPETLPEDIDEAPAPLEKTYSILGDVFEIDGKHRVMCGDSTKESDVSILMNGNKADMVFTDPPYGVDYGNKNEYLNKSDGGNRIETKILNDTVEENCFELWAAHFKQYENILADYHSIYVASPQTRDLMMMMMRMMIEEGGIYISNVIIWVKNNHVLGRLDYMLKHEPIIYGWLKKGHHKFYGKGEQKFSVWEYNKPLKNDLHPTMKPIELIVNAIQNSSPKDGVIFDGFLGSGSTLIAAETTKRICYGMEIDQHYSDVILRRYKKTFPNATFKCLTRNDFPFEELFNAG